LTAEGKPGSPSIKGAPPKAYNEIVDMNKIRKSGTHEKQSVHKGSITAFFSSLSLTITLLILLAIVSIVGTIVPQNASPDHLARLYGPGLHAVFEKLGFFDIYHSLLFVSLLLLLSLNLLVCSARNLPRTIRIITQSKDILDPERLKTLPYTGSARLALSPEEAGNRLRSVLTRYCGHPSESVESGSFHFFCQRGKFSRLGVYLTHLSVILILLGGLIGSLLGFRGVINLIEGERTGQVFLLNNGMSSRNLGFEIRCDDFEVTYYPSGMPQDYKSTLTVIEDGKDLFSRTIEVNHPLRYKGLSFYQSSYGTTSTTGDIVITAQKKNSGSPAQTFTVAPGGSFSLPEPNLVVRVGRFFNDFVIDDQGQPVNKSDQPNNPAAELLIARNGETLYRTWIFQNFPDFHGLRGDYTFTLQGFTGKEYTGLQVASDPGEKIVWLGCILMIVGILGTFFSSHQQIWARMSVRKERVDITLAGTANKNRLAFEKMFRKLEEEVQRLAPDHDKDKTQESA